MYPESLTRHISWPWYLNKNFRGQKFDLYPEKYGSVLMLQIAYVMSYMV